MPHQEDESLCAFMLWRAYVLGVLRGELLPCKKWAESPTSGFENKNLINCQGGELNFFLQPLLLEMPFTPYLPLRFFGGMGGFPSVPGRLELSCSMQVPPFHKCA